jgi:hypothetical protein
MKYQIMQRDYVNTGGSCMVGVTKVDLGYSKPLYVNCDEESYSIVTVDHINSEQEIDDYERITVDCMLWDYLTSNHPHFNMLVDCYNYYYQHDLKRFGAESVGRGRQDLLAAYRRHSQDTDSALYHLNVARDALRDVMAEMKPVTAQMTNAENYITNLIQREITVDEMVRAVNAFKFSYMRLTEQWSLYDEFVNSNNMNLVENYPFDRSFDDINVEEWCDNVLEMLADAHMNK